MVILTDDEDRENEGDLVLPVQHVTPEAITFMLSVARGYMCVSLTERDCDRLDLHPQSPQNTTMRNTAFTVSLDGHPKHGFTTGVSAAERAKCIRMLIDERYGAGDFTRPGHINPLRSRDGGVLVRTGQTEGSVDLCRLAGLYPAAIIIEIMRDDGEMARVPDLAKLAQQHNLKMCSVSQIIEHRLSQESLVQRAQPAKGTPISTPHGEFTLLTYHSRVDELPHLVLTCGGVGAPDSAGHVLATSEPTLVRMHRRDLLGDVFGDIASTSGPHSSGDLLHASMRAIQQAGRGAIVYLRPEQASSGRLAITSPRRPSPEDGMRVEPNEPGGSVYSSLAPDSPHREFGVGSQILRDLGLTRLRLLTNRASARPGLEAFGIHVDEIVSIDGPA